MTINDWVVVQLPTDNGRSSKRFIAQIVKVKNGRLVGDFLRAKATKEKSGYVYGYPEVKHDISFFHFYQIVKKLAPPATYLRSLFYFSDMHTREL